jgi:hypothetical protein
VLLWRLVIPCLKTDRALFCSLFGETLIIAFDNRRRVAGLADIVGEARKSERHSNKIKTNQSIAHRLYPTWALGTSNLRTSPYQAVQVMMWVMERVLPVINSNVFGWNHMRMNLLSSADYDPASPWALGLQGVEGWFGGTCFMCVPLCI